MNEFVEKFQINKVMLKKEISEWRKKIKQTLQEKNPISQKLILTIKIICSISILAFLAALICWIIMLTLNNAATNNLIFNFSIGFFLISIIALLTLTIIFLKIQSKNRQVMKTILNNDGIAIYKQWFAKTFNYEMLSNEHKKTFAVSNAEIKFLVNKYKYRTIGTPSNVSQTYDIMGGSIFNNPFNLSCGVYKSIINTGKSVHFVYEYMPLLQIQTSYFQNCDIKITNSKAFSGYGKNQLKFENEQFLKKFWITTQNYKEALMIFTALVQEKWVETIKIAPKFQMHIKNGMITVLFQGFNQNSGFQYGKTTIAFMNVLELFKASFFSKLFFQKLEKNAMNNLLAFSEILNLVFSIPFFQWENLTNKASKT